MVSLQGTLDFHRNGQTRRVLMTDNTDNEIKKIWKFAVDPGHLVLAGLLVAAWFVGTWLYADRRAAAADKANAVLEAQYKEADKANKDFQASVAAQLQSLTQQNAALAQQNSSLAASIASRSVVLQQQERANSVMSPDELANHWSQLIRLPVTVGASGYQVPQISAVATVNKLDEDVKLNVDVVDLNKTISNLQVTIQNDGHSLDLEKQAHASDDKTCVENVDKLNAEIKQVKADASRSNHRWGLAGAIFGALVRSLFKI
jgi:hypothetical protein